MVILGSPVAKPVPEMVPSGKCKSAVVEQMGLDIVLSKPSTSSWVWGRLDHSEGSLCGWPSLLDLDGNSRSKRIQHFSNLEEKKTLVEKRYFRKVLSCVAAGGDGFGGYLKKRQCIFRTGLADEGQMKYPSHGRKKDSPCCNAGMRGKIFPPAEPKFSLPLE